MNFETCWSRSWPISRNSVGSCLEGYGKIRKDARIGITAHTRTGPRRIRVWNTEILSQVSQCTCCSFLCLQAVGDSLQGLLCGFHSTVNPLVLLMNTGCLYFRLKSTPPSLARLINGTFLKREVTGCSERTDCFIRQIYISCTYAQYSAEMRDVCTSGMTGNAWHTLKNWWF